MPQQSPPFYQWFGILFLSGAVGLLLPVGFSLASRFLTGALKLAAGGSGKEKLKRSDNENTKLRADAAGPEMNIGSIGVRFNSRFFQAALLSIAFIANLLLLAPLATASHHKEGLFLLTVGSLMLGVALLYVIRKGDLGWIRKG